MNVHDPVCTMVGSGVASKACRCQFYAAVRADERRSVEKRIRESGVARWLPSHAWDKLIGCVRGGAK